MSFSRNFNFKPRESADSFNMTPIIDIVFLLIIFFVVVCQFIEAENFPVSVPDKCNFAEQDSQLPHQITTLTVMKTDDEKTAFAVGSDTIMATDRSEIVEQIAHLINARMESLAPESRIVNLRIDKDIKFAQAQYALAGIAQSIAKDIKIATLKQPAPDSAER